MRLAIFLIILAMLASAFGFGGLAEAAAGFAKILFFIFLVCAVFALVFD